MTTDNLFIPDNIPDSAKMLSSEKFTWLAYLLVVPILAIAYAGIVIRRPYVVGIAFNKIAFFIGVGLSIVFLVVHELIHALCCPRDTTVFCLSYFCWDWLCAGVRFEEKPLSSGCLNANDYVRRYSFYYMDMLSRHGCHNKLYFVCVFHWQSINVCRRYL